MQAAEQVQVCWGDDAGLPGQLVDETAIGLFVTLVRRLVAPAALPLLQVSFINPAPADLSPYVGFFGCTVCFGQPQTQVVLAAAGLALPLRQPDPALQRILDQQAQIKVLTLTHFRRPLPRIKADPRALAQIVMNLVANSLKFTPKGGSIEVMTGLASDGRPEIVVRDTGIGIPAHQQELIFEAFRQADGSTHRKYGGTGLGLSISRDLAQLLGGSIHVHSTPGEGSVFTLVLPQKLVPPSLEVSQNRG